MTTEFVLFKFFRQLLLSFLALLLLFIIYLRFDNWFSNFWWLANFFALFKYYFLNVLNHVSDTLLISFTELELIFDLINATPGLFATKITGFLAIIIVKPNHNIGITIIVVLVSYIFITAPVVFIMILANNKSWKNIKNKLFHNIYKITKPVTIVILIWIVIGLISNFSWIYEKSAKFIQAALYLVISFIISFVCIVLKLIYYY